MLLYFLYFLLPWIVFLTFVKKKELHQLIIYGILGALIAFIWDYFRKKFHWWEISDAIPWIETEFLANLGIFPIEAMLVVLLMPQTRWYKPLFLLGFASFTTGVEYLMLIVGHVTYSGGWNLYWTWLAYFSAYSFIAIFHEVYARVKN